MDFCVVSTLISALVAAIPRFHVLVGRESGTMSPDAELPGPLAAGAATKSRGTSRDAPFAETAVLLQAPNLTEFSVRLLLYMYIH